jgi:hypothetical protein
MPTAFTQLPHEVVADCTRLSAVQAAIAQIAGEPQGRNLLA